MIATERTGTNYLCELLGYHPQIAARYEIFSNMGVMMWDEEVETLCKAQNWSFVDRSHPDLIKRFKKRPRRILKLIGRRLPSEKKICSFKVFHDHLPPRQLARLIKDYEVIFVTRRVIDTYVSFVKAMETEEWLRLDTTQIKPALRIDDFIDWYRSRHQYYKGCADRYTRTHHKTVTLLKYEEFTDRSDLENLKSACQKITAATGIDLYIPSQEFELKTWKQDSSQLVVDKVSNWQEFEAQLKERGLLEIAFDYFLGPTESLYSAGRI
ncbi:hypothetical protein [cf. Phormidesmis sp. LEGE 11477]|uniref:hypothetical protein n=1 Tax=cf. Phormidesmis sp. LEGE 11477 TaxID=1828680 RepID=UPI001882D39E